MRSTALHESRISIGLLERDPLRRVGFQSLLGQIPQLRLSAMTESDVVAHSCADVLLIGNHSPRFLETLGELKAACPELRILVIGMGTDDETILKAIAHGAKGYVEESSTAADLARAIRVVHQGSVWAPRRVLSMLIERSSDLLRDPQACSASLTSREKEVLNQLVEGRSNKEIGALLGIGVRTVKAHVARLLRKVGAKNRISLSMQAIRNSLVTVH